MSRCCTPNAARRADRAIVFSTFAFLLVSALHLSAPRALAQCVTPFSQDGIPECPREPVPDRASKASRHFAAASVNVAIGGVIAAVRARVGQRPVWPAFLGGAAGGAVAYGGKRLIGTRTPIAGIVGRQTSAIGAAMVNNAAEGRPLFTPLVFPIGPVRLYVRDRSSSGEPARTHAKIDLAGALATIYYAAQPGAKLDPVLTLAASAPVFVGNPPGEGLHIASHSAGVIAIDPDLGGPGRRRSVAHELIHASQYDFAFITMSAPAEKIVLGSHPTGRWLHKYFDLSLNAPALMLLNAVIEHDKRPWETEAVLMVER